MAYFRLKNNTEPSFRSDEKPAKKDLKDTPKGKPFMKRKPIKKKYKPTGEAEMFKQIWEERNHICTNCRTLLGDEAQVWFFAHIKSKKKFPELRLVKSNIMLHCLKCHHEYDNGTHESYAKRFKD